MEMFQRRDGLGLESRYQDWHLPFNFHDGGFLEIGVNPNIEEVRDPFTINNARGVRVDPGPLRVQRVVRPVEDQQRRTFLVRQPLFDRRVLRRLPARLHLRPGGAAERALQRLGQPADQRHRAVERLVRLEAGDEPRQLQLQHEDVRQRAGAVQHRLAAAGARTCGSTSSTARSATSSSSTTSATTSAPIGSIARSSRR